MFYPAEALRDNPALFACYILFVYFRGKNAVRIEREMRALGHHTFHRRNLYPRGNQPGWIGKFGWQQRSLPPAVAGGLSEHVKVSTDKLTRALTWSPIAEDGKVILVRSAASVPPAVAGGAFLHKPARQQGRYQDSTHRLLKQDERDLQDGLRDTEISPRITTPEKYPVHPHHPVKTSSQPTHADWISELLDELTAFPNGTHDDQIDAISIAVQMHAIKPNRAVGMLIT